MKTFKFEGYSDDTFGEYGVTNDDVDNCAKNAPIQCDVISSDGQLSVVGHYWISPSPHGCWTIGIAPIDEDVKIPAWPVRFKLSDEGYSPSMEIDAPDDAKLTWYSNGNLVNA